MSSTRLQCLIQEVFYNSESKATYSRGFSFPTEWFKNMPAAHFPAHIHTHTCDRILNIHRCTHFHTSTRRRAHSHTLMHLHSNTLAHWCFEDRDSVLRRQAARRSWPSLGTDEQECVFLCLGERVCMHAWASTHVHACMTIYSLMCVHTGLVHSCVFRKIVHLRSLGQLKAGV